MIPTTLVTDPDLIKEDEDIEGGYYKIE